MLRNSPLCTSDNNEFSVDYELKEELGKGSFSEVWLCARRCDGAEFAAKILKKKYGRTMDEDTWNTISEVLVATSIEQHPFLLTTEGAYHEIESGKIVLLTELMKKSLYDIIEAGQDQRHRMIPDSRIKCYMYQMLEGLKYLHENGIIHRDIKPENVLLRSADQLLKIGDFGNACRVSTNGGPYTEYVATRWYRSPECMLTRGRYGTKMDVWAAGCVLYEMATFLPLFDGSNENEQLDKIERVLGTPSYRLVDRFSKCASSLLTVRYETDKPNLTAAGVGLHAVYQPFRPAYELLKDMIVYDPIKRFSADRLLRKPYFYEMRHTPYEYKIKQFQMTSNGLLSGEQTSNPTRNRSDYRSMSKKRGPAGDRASYLLRANAAPWDETIKPHGAQNDQPRDDIAAIRNARKQRKNVDQSATTTDQKIANNSNNALPENRKQIDDDANASVPAKTASTLNRTSSVAKNVKNIWALRRRPPFK